MRQDFADFLALPANDRRDVLQITARRLDTVPSYVEKDFWVCVVLDTIFNNLPVDHPRLFFKGGTSLSKGFGLIQRFSEDIDVVVSREDLGFGRDRDPTALNVLSNRARRALFEQLRSACSRYIHGDLAESLANMAGDLASVVPDTDDGHQQTLLIQYPTLFPDTDTQYVQPQVKLEAGARSALEPCVTTSVHAYIEEEIPEMISPIDSIRMIAPERTFLEKLLILHGAFCGYRDEGRLPTDRNRISRHYYDVAMMCDTNVGTNALADAELLNDVRSHNLVAFRQAWKRFEEALPGTIGVIPPDALREAVEQDYNAMRDMILGDAPEFAWIIQTLEQVDARINSTDGATPRYPRDGNGSPAGAGNPRQSVTRELG